MLQLPDHSLPIQKPASRASFTALFCAITLSAASGAATAAADELQAPPQARSFYVEAGYTDHRGPAMRTRTLGLRVPLQYSWWQGRIRTHLDVYLSDWASTAAPPARRHNTQLGVVPMARYRFADGQSPWFVEGGIGLSYLMATHHTPNGPFGSRWNFSDHLGVGRNFGAQRQHEVSLQANHVSNAGLRQPNPGETFVQIRYAHRF